MFIYRVERKSQQRYLPRLRAYLTQQLRVDALIDEVCQDVLVVIWQRAADLYPTTRVVVI
jgi:DNA-directed RNA polymerase specialized sigma24 family protein